MTSAAKPKTPLQSGESRAYPVLPLRDIVVFPHMIVPLFVGREKSIKALEEVMRSDTFILLATQKNASDDDPATDAIYGVGTLASVLQLLKLPDGTVKVLVEGAARATVKQYTDRTDYYKADAVVVADFPRKERCGGTDATRCVPNRRCRKPALVRRSRRRLHRRRDRTGRHRCRAAGRCLRPLRARSPLPRPLQGSAGRTLCRAGCSP